MDLFNPMLALVLVMINWKRFALRLSVLVTVRHRSISRVNLIRLCLVPFQCCLFLHVLVRLFSRRDEAVYIEKRAGNEMSYEVLKPVTQTTKTLSRSFTVITLLIAPSGAPLMGTLMLGNFLRECKVVGNLVKSAENEIASITTLSLGLTLRYHNGDVS